MLLLELLRLGGSVADPRSAVEDPRHPTFPPPSIDSRCLALPGSELPFSSRFLLYISLAGETYFSDPLGGEAVRLVSLRSVAASRFQASGVDTLCSLLGYLCAERLEGMI